MYVVSSPGEVHALVQDHVEEDVAQICLSPDNHLRLALDLLQVTHAQTFVRELFALLVKKFTPDRVHRVVLLDRVDFDLGGFVFGFVFTPICAATSSLFIILLGHGRRRS